ncbi:MAG: Fibronectin type-III domain-containing protein [Nitrospira sp.]|nr:MAG: Fibronectin type-III domain-containing protein [Nitrospira sp.]
MIQAQQHLPFRRGALIAVSYRLCFFTSLALMMGIWTGPEVWALTANPTTVTFQAVQGATNPPSQTINMSRSGRRQRSFTARDSRGWLTVSPATGSITSSAQVALAVNTAGLPAGTYTARVTITLDNGESTAVPVTLKVAEVPASSPPPPPPPTSGTKASLSWSPVTSTDVAGYKVYIGSASGRYGTPLDVGNITSYVANSLAVGTTYYFVVTSYSSSGSESPYSNEVSKSIY